MCPVSGGRHRVCHVEPLDLRPRPPWVSPNQCRTLPSRPTQGRRAWFSLFIFISLYLIYGFTLDTSESLRVNFKYYLILQTGLLMLAVIRGPLRGCRRERSEEPALSESPENALGLARAHGGVGRLS